MKLFQFSHEYQRLGPVHNDFPLLHRINRYGPALLKMCEGKKSTGVQAHCLKKAQTKLDSNMKAALLGYGAFFSLMALLNQSPDDLVTSTKVCLVM